MTEAWDDTTGGFVTATAEYDPPTGNLTAAVDRLGNRTEFLYDTAYQRFVVETRNPLYFAGNPPDTRQKTTAIWDTVCGAPSITTGLNGQDTTYAYDALCRPIRTDTPGGNFTITRYMNLGDPLAQYIETETPPADGSGNIWARAYLDGLGRTIRTLAKGPAAGQEIESLTGYNARGAVASLSASYYLGETPQVTAYDYDALDRPVRVTHPDLNVVETSYGIGDTFAQVTRLDELGQEARAHKDAFGRTLRLERLLGGVPVVTEYEWDPLGRLTGLADDAGNPWIYSYDSLGRQLAASDPDMGTWTYEYDAAGRLTAQADAMTPTPQSTELSYDARGRVLTKTSRAGTAEAETTSWTYDQEAAGFYNVGRLTTLGNAVGMLRYDYDRDGRLAETLYSLDGTDYGFATGYDPAGRVLWQLYPDGDGVGSAADPIRYAAAGRRMAVPGLVSDTVHDARGLATAVRRANGVDTSYDYAPERGWLLGLQTFSGATAIQDLSYTRDAKGRIEDVASTAAKESWSYGYDELDRLMSATNWDDASLSQTFAYDTVGNMTFNSALGSYQYPAPGGPRPHGVTQAGGMTYAYDANGNMTDGGGRSYLTDGDNRPVEISGVIFAYGPDGARWKKSIDNGLKGKKKGTIITLTLGSIEIDTGAGTTTKYLPGGAKRIDAASYWLHADHLGSIHAITDGAGAEVQRRSYAPYGERLSQAGSHLESKDYLGERLDEETGLLFLNARVVRANWLESARHAL